MKIFQNKKGLGALVELFIGTMLKHSTLYHYTSFKETQSFLEQHADRLSKY